MEFLIGKINMLGLIVGKCSMLGSELTEILNEIFTWIQIATPCLVLVLCTVDMAKAVISQDDKGIKEAQSHAIKRIIIGVAVFFVPIVINLLLDFASLATGTCQIGG